MASHAPTTMEAGVPKWFTLKIAPQSRHSCGRHRDTPPVMSFTCVQSKCKKYWCDEINKPFEIVDRGFTVTVTAKKLHADYDIRDITIRRVSV